MNASDVDRLDASVTRLYFMLEGKASHRQGDCQGSPLNEIQKVFVINGDMSSVLFFQDIRAVTIHTAS